MSVLTDLLEGLMLYSGAGKDTTNGCIRNAVRKDRGDIRVFGRKIYHIIRFS